MPTNRYFAKAKLVPPKPPKVPKVKPLKVKAHEYVRVKNPYGPGTLQVNARWAMQQLGRQKGAQVIHAQGKAHRWTSEEARAAVNKCWNTRWKMNKRIGVRVGKAVKRKPRLDRIAIRAAHRREPNWLPPVGTYVYDDGSWWKIAADGIWPISEHTALIKLGHLKSGRGFVPSESRGTIDALIRERRAKQKEKKG